MKELKYSFGNKEIKVEGFFLYKNAYGVRAVKLFFEDFLCEKALFDNLYGTYLVEMSYPNNKKVFFSDNSGMRRFFINYKDLRFEKTFSEALPNGNNVPNYGAIAQFLYFGCVYSCDTIECNVRLSNPNSYYIVRDGKIEELDKGLQPLDKIEHNEDILANVMSKVTKATDDYKNCFCTITGGIAVLF